MKFVAPVETVSRFVRKNWRDVGRVDVVSALNVGLDGFTIEDGKIFKPDLSMEFAGQPICSMSVPGILTWQRQGELSLRRDRVHGLILPKKELIFYDRILAALRQEIRVCDDRIKENMLPVLSCEGRSLTRVVLLIEEFSSYLYSSAR